MSVRSTHRKSATTGEYAIYVSEEKHLFLPENFEPNPSLQAHRTLKVGYMHFLKMKTPIYYNYCFYIKPFLYKKQKQAKIQKRKIVMMTKLINGISSRCSFIQQICGTYFIAKQYVMVAPATPLFFLSDLKRVVVSFQNTTVQYYLKCIAMGLSCLHHLKISHGALSLMSIALDQSGKPMLTDINCRFKSIFSPMFDIYCYSLMAGVLFCDRQKHLKTIHLTQSSYNGACYECRINDGHQLMEGKIIDLINSLLEIARKSDLHFENNYVIQWKESDNWKYVVKNLRKNASSSDTKSHNDQHETGNSTSSVTLPNLNQNQNASSFVEECPGTILAHSFFADFAELRALDTMKPPEDFSWAKMAMQALYSKKPDVEKVIATSTNGMELAGILKKEANQSHHHYPPNAYCMYG